MTAALEGSAQWASALRKRAATSIKAVTNSYVELAEILYLVSTTPVDNISSNLPVFTLWGYTTMDQYAKEELGLEPRKAFYLIKIGKALCVELKNVDPLFRQRLIDIGWAKLRELAPIIKAEQIEDWLLKVEQASYKEVQDMCIRYKLAQEQYLDDMNNSASLNIKDPAGMPLTTALDPVSVGSISTGAEFDEPKEKVNANSIAEELKNITVPVPSLEKIIGKTFSWYEGQFETVIQALKKAREITGSDKDGHNMHMICTDFLATNTFSGATITQKLEYISKLEDLLGIKLIVATKNNEVVYGMTTLENVAKAYEPMEVSR